MSGLLNLTLEIPPAELEKLEALKREGGSLIYTPNHSTVLDPLVYSALPLDTCIMGTLSAFSFKSWVGKIPGANALKARAMQKNGIFSVRRGGSHAEVAHSLEEATELVAQGKNLLIFPEGWMAHSHKYVHPAKPGAGFIAMGAVEQGGKVKLVPVVAHYRMAGSPEQVSENLGWQMGLLELDLKRRNVLLAPQKPSKSLIERLDILMASMVAEREGFYAKKYLVTVPSGDSTPFERLERMTDQILTHLEQQYPGGRPGPFVSQEQRARKLGEWMRTLAAEAPEPQKAQMKLDLKALADCINLSMYMPEAYTDEKPLSIQETLAKLHRDIHQNGPPGYSKGGLLKRVTNSGKKFRTYRQAEMTARIKIGEPIDVNQFMADHPVKTMVERKDQAHALVDEVRCRLQQGLDELA